MKGLADGSLDIEKFRSYIVQDRMYLGRFIRRWLWISVLRPGLQTGELDL